MLTKCTFSIKSVGPQYVNEGGVGTKKLFSIPDRTLLLSYFFLI